MQFLTLQCGIFYIFLKNIFSTYKFLDKNDNISYILGRPVSKVTKTALLKFKVELHMEASTYAEYTDD